LPVMMVFALGGMVILKLTKCTDMRRFR
jgi:hypothetical protein